MTEEIQRLLDEAQRLRKAASDLLAGKEKAMTGEGDKPDVGPAIQNRMRIGTRHHCEHLTENGTFLNGFNGCVAHMMSKCGGSHNEFHAKAICGMIAHKKDEAHG